MEFETREQADSKLWQEHRCKRITSSNFGLICKARPSTDLTKLAKSLVSPADFNSRATAHGRQYEPVAVEMFEQATGLVASRCGLFVSQHQPYLAASPDRLVDDDTVLEVKCPFAARKQLISPATVPYLRKVDNELNLDHNHNYYYQVQGQLFCAEKTSCLFCVFTLADLVVIKIERDDAFIAHMVNRLCEFFAKYFRQAVLEKHMYRFHSHHFC